IQRHVGDSYSAFRPSFDSYQALWSWGPFCIPCGPDKQTNPRSKDLLSFCSNVGVEVQAIERTPSMSELNLACMLENHMLDEVAAF
nr:DENN (AEX-3) domain-containing protein [Tanacetum cinerariifolium]